MRLLTQIAFFLTLLTQIALGQETGTHWSFVMPTAPVIEGAGHPVDVLLARGQREANLQPGPVASREVLLRRAWHVLTGLQPSDDTREDLLGEPSEDLTPWIVRVVNRGLATEQFGERWARHWLDVVRYADTKGYNFTAGRRFPFAFTFRDWVVRSLNEDLSYDEFLRRQVAADLMDVPVQELAALGFLTLGRRYLNRRELIIADRIDVTFRSTMGLTMQCARCHDHKSDPISIADYYGIYGVFDNTEEVPENQLPVIYNPKEGPAYAKYQKELKTRALKVHEFLEKKIKGYQRPDDLVQFDRKAVKRKLNQTENNQYVQLLARITELEANSEFAPLKAMAVRDRSSLREAVVFLRGQPGNRGPKVPRAFPAFFRKGGEEHFKQGSGRLELARELTHPENPLTARVAANRVWMHVMGSPLVATPGDFGLQCAEPVQRELLDHLAIYLMGHQWSTKALIRHIMTSKAWARTSATTAEHVEADPENNYYARSNRHRKNLEAWRDSTLQVSGRLNRRVGGRPVKIHQAPFPPRRTIYGLIERQNPPSFFRIFDFPESNQPVVLRTTTTTPNQALYLMNSPFLHGEARVTAARTESIADARERVRQLYQLVLQREATRGELARALAFVAAGGKGGQSAGAWSYGHGRYHRGDKRVEFQALPHFTGSSWQGGPDLPDPKTGWVHLRAGSGHPGHGDHAAILRWRAPRDVQASLQGTLERPAEQGDGLRVLALVEGQVLATWEVGPRGKVPTTLEDLTLRSGQFLDLVVESKGEEGWDSFTWNPIITEPGATLPLAEAKAGFSGPGLDVWPQLAQVLLLSNEFLFVD